MSYSPTAAGTLNNPILNVTNVSHLSVSTLFSRLRVREWFSFDAFNQSASNILCANGTSLRSILGGELS